MTVATVTGWDAEGQNVHLVPVGAGPYGGGYLTGSGGVPWSAAQMREFPNAVLYDQSPTNGPFDTTCDAFDCETNAVTMADLAPGIIEARAHFHAATRPGQRWPAVYQSQNNVTQNVNDLIAAGIDTCPLIVANYGVSQADAIAIVANASGPFPIVGFQYSDQGGNGAYDLDVWSVPWLVNRSKKVDPVTPQMPPGPWNPAEEYPWKGAILTVIGQDGLIHAYEYDLKTGTWKRLDTAADTT